MDLHDFKALSRLRILRVLGGWIYCTLDATKVEVAVLVPQAGS